MKHDKKHMKFKKTNKWMVDMDYYDKLPPTEQAYLAKFANEYYENHFGQDPLHNKDQRLQCGRTDHARRRCVYNIQDSGNAILKFAANTDLEKHVRLSNPEDAIIDLLDIHDKKKRKEK